MSPDSGTLAFIRIAADKSADVYAWSLKGEPQPRAIVQGPAYEGGPQFSSDGRSLAYASHESGQHFVMVKDESVSGRLNVVLNWFDEITRLVPKP